MTGQVEAIQYAPERGAPRVQATWVELRENSGIVGDAYAGEGDRQVVLLFAPARRRISLAVGSAREGLCYPRFRENLRVAGVDPGGLVVGQRLIVGSAVLEVTDHKKRCFRECLLPPDECAIRAHVAFCRVCVGGEIHLRDPLAFEKT